MQVANSPRRWRKPAVSPPQEDSQKFSGTGIACDLLHLANNGTVKQALGKLTAHTQYRGLSLIPAMEFPPSPARAACSVWGLLGLPCKKGEAASPAPLKSQVNRDRGGAVKLRRRNAHRTVTVKSGASLTAVGAQNGIEGSVLGDGTVFQLTAAPGPEDIVTEDKSTGLDLRGVAKTTLYTNVGGGTALWEYSGDPGTTPHTLTLKGTGSIMAAERAYGIAPSRGQQAGGSGRRPLDGQGGQIYDGIYSQETCPCR